MIKELKAQRNDTPITMVCVSDQQESEIALRFACMRAKRRNHHVCILHVIEPTEFQGLLSITDAIRDEQEEKAQALMSRMADVAAEEGVQNPMLVFHEGLLSESIISTAEENPGINMIMLGLAPDSHRGGKLAATLVEELGVGICIPLMFIPGNLTQQQLQMLT